MVNKLPGIKQFREINDVWIQKIPWPNINPSIFTVLQVVPAIIAALYFYSLTIVFWMVVVMLFFDLADGAIAKKHKKESKFGYYMDLMFDRLTETIIFLPLMNGWLLIAIINSILSLISMKKDLHLSIPLRQAYGLYLLFIVFF